MSCYDISLDHRMYLPEKIKNVKRIELYYKSILV